ncbi:MAG: AAA family ATPase [Candidatus Jordarchaeales archaeon]
MASEEAIMWTEKYRPRTLNDMVNQAEIVSRLKMFVEKKDMPHCLFSGPPGTGKTTAALCLAHDLLENTSKETSWSLTPVTLEALT